MERRLSINMEKVYEREKEGHKNTKKNHILIYYIFFEFETLFNGVLSQHHK